MPLQELTEPEVLDRLEKSSREEAFVFFTPFCGTCALAEKMLEVVQATGKSMALARININYAPRLRDLWQITSVPCLVIIRGGKVSRKETVMQGVDHLYELLRLDRQ